MKDNQTTRGYKSMKPYVTEPLTDFTYESNIKDFQEAIKYVESQLGKEYSIMIGGEKIYY